MLSTTYAAREARLRRLARRQGLSLVRSRRTMDDGCYAVINASNGVEAGIVGSRFVMDLDDVERYLTEA